MDNEQDTYIADFIKELLPCATTEEQRVAQANLDRFLEAIDCIHARLERDGWYLHPRDKFLRDGNVKWSAQEPMNGYYAYIRVSTVKQGEKGVSLPEQRSAIEVYAQRHQLNVVEWFEEKVTAAKRGRPVFSRMFAALRAGHAQGIIIHKIDRSTRNHHDWADLRELADAGIEIHAADGSLDLRSRGGKLSADIQAVFAIDYINNLREEVRKGIQGRLKQGLYPLPAPLGYLNNGKGNPKTLDPITAPLVRKAFELYATGKYNLRTLGAELYSLGLRNRRGGRVTKTGLSTLLNHPFYIGIIRIRRTGAHYQGIHEPLVAKSLFDQVQRLLHRKTQSRGWKHDFLYRKVLRCRHCERVLVGEWQKGHVYYRCHSPRCPRPSLREEDVIAQVAQSLAKLQLTSREYALLEAHLRRGDAIRSTTKEKDLQALTLRLAQIDVRLNRLFDAYIDDPSLDKDMYETRKTSLLHERAAFKEQLANIQSGNSVREEKRRQKLELVKTLSLWCFPGNEEEELNLLQRTSSNLGANGKYLVVDWESPFGVLAAREEFQYGAPHRDSSRTLVPDGHNVTYNTPQQASPEATHVNASNTENGKKPTSRQRANSGWMEEWLRAIADSLESE